LTSRSADDCSIEPHIEDLISRFQPIAKELAHAPAVEKIYVSCTVRVAKNGATPAVVFDRKALTFLASIGAELGVDIYLDA
jgi:hypothetical protein